MNKKLLIILVLVIILLIVGNAYFYFIYLKRSGIETLINENVNITVNEPIQIKGISPPEDLELEYEASAKAAFTHYSALALEEKDSRYCLRIEDETQKNICLDRIRQIKLKSPQNAQDCLDLINENEQIDCMENLALAQNDIKICDNLFNQINQDICNKTYISENLKMGDTRVCNNLTEQTAIDQCLDSAYFNKAFNENNSTYCDKIINQEVRDGCLAELGQ